MTMTNTMSRGIQPVAPARRRFPGSPLASGPFSHLAPERDRLACLQWQHFDAEQVGATVGAQIVGVHLAEPLSDAVFGELRAALHDYKVPFFRNQRLTSQAHVALARFQKDAALSGYENVWHHDVTWRPEPSIAATLHAIDVPPVGGDTYPPHAAAITVTY